MSYSLLRIEKLFDALKLAGHNASHFSQFLRKKINNSVKQCELIL